MSSYASFGDDTQPTSIYPQLVLQRHICLAERFNLDFATKTLQSLVLSTAVWHRSTIASSIKTMSAPTPSSTRASALFLLATLLVLASTASAQVSSAFAGTSFPLSSYTVSNTFTPITTFSQASGGNPTVIGGPGPTPATSSYQFTYTVPTQTVEPIFPSSVYASLASHGEYNTATDAKNLVPDPNNLQIANTAADAFNYAAAKAIFITVAAAAVVVVLL